MSSTLFGSNIIYIRSDRFSVSFVPLHCHFNNYNSVIALFFSRKIDGRREKGSFIFIKIRYKSRDSPLIIKMDGLFVRIEFVYEIYVYTAI